MRVSMCVSLCVGPQHISVLLTHLYQEQPQGRSTTPEMGQWGLEAQLGNQGGEKRVQA